MITKLSKLNCQTSNVPYHNSNSRMRIPMTLLDRSQIVRTADRAPPAHGKELVVGILLAVLIATLAIRNLVPADALAPAIATLMFVVGAAAAGAAWLCQAGRFRLMWLAPPRSLAVLRVRLSPLR